MKNKRRFIDAPTDQRCTANARVGRKGELAQCGRYRKVGTFCLQHAKIAAQKEGM